MFNLSETKHVSSVLKDNSPRHIKCTEYLIVVTTSKLGMLFKER